LGSSLTLCDLTQSYASTGGGIRTYLTTKRGFLDQNTDHRHLLIVPGPEDKTTRDGRHITVEIASPKVPGSPKYRLLLRSKAVIRALHEHAPDTIECLDAYNLPWAAISYRRDVPETALIAGYRTDFPTVYIEAISRKFIGSRLAKRLKSRAYKYAGKLYREFDAVYALNAGMARHLESLGTGDVDIMPLGTDLSVFNPDKRDQGLRDRFGVAPGDPLLIYVGRIDREKQADIVVEAFLHLPETMNAALIMLGEGNLKAGLIEKTAGRRVHFPGYISDRTELARNLASSDLYVSAMAFETFGISIIEAQACGLPVIGVAAGAMPDRVPEGLGLLGPVGHSQIMADNILKAWNSPERPEMSAQARKHVEDNFSWDRTFANLYNNIYARAMNGRDLSIL